MDKSINLSHFFSSNQSYNDEFEKLLLALKDVDPTIALLTLEGLQRIEESVKRGQMATNAAEKQKIILCNWLLQHRQRVQQNDDVFKGMIIFEALGKKSESTPFIDIFKFFESENGCKEMLNDLIDRLGHLNNPVIAVLTLEGLYGIQSKMQSKVFELTMEDNDILTHLKNFLRNWRRYSLLSEKYQYDLVLRNLTIFKKLNVPLFIDNYGVRNNNFREELGSFNNSHYESLQIDENKIIFHVTHVDEAEKIRNDKKFKASDNKNSIKGVWFGIDDPQQGSSVYGSQSFQTTLKKLGIKGLHQGEIVSYKHEVNVILYAANDTNYEDLRRPSDNLVKKVQNDNAYVNISIFVSECFLPDDMNFQEIITGPNDVNHGGFCVRNKRTGYDCNELTMQI